MKKLYVFGMNYNPIDSKEEQELTEIKIPAENDNEAIFRLRALVGRVIAKKCYINDIRDY